MKQSQSTSDKAANWELPAGLPAKAANRTEADIAEWQELAMQVAETATQNNWSKAEVARRIGMPDGTFSQWFSASYNGRLANQNAAVKSWLSALAEAQDVMNAIPPIPPFQRLKMTNEIIETLTFAQATGDMVMITVAAGNGKTEAVRYYRKTRPHVYLITASPQTKGVYGTLLDLAAELDITETNSARLPRAIGRKLERMGGDGLLCVDEAQNLTDEAVNQLRHFVDNYSCGLALLGNDEIYLRFRQSRGRASPQIKSRVAKHFSRKNPYEADLRARIAAWGVSDERAVKFLIGIGLKAGALRQVDKTLLLAGIVAAGSSAPMDYRHIEAAWKNRDVDGLANF